MSIKLFYIAIWFHIFFSFMMMTADGMLQEEKFDIDVSASIESSSQIQTNQFISANDELFYQNDTVQGNGLKNFSQLGKYQSKALIIKSNIDSQDSDSDKKVEGKGKLHLNNLTYEQFI